MSFWSLVARRDCRRKLSAFSLLLVAVLFAGACGGDPREYPDSGSTSLEELLRHFELELPPCDVADLRYADTGGPRSTGLYLTYTFPADCIDEFLASARVDSSAKRPLLGKNVPFSPQLVQDYDWPIDPDKTYDRYGKSAQAWSVFIVLDSSSPRHTAFIEGLGD
ncbi:hypothetical protein F4560_003216 [Saccharothrix ecbatanensis]|uniref:Uncharacterized protein n=1 Tax=Saccharothrix ecbatanensis TaxID=1105145 RepID=A0A7W9HJI9_9PSEU|nr:hypothetical protein [Saccharothrix ecbatanensis]MBB5803448.1 hypothetical protein [Saccharothrix ecbatanensis]